MTLSTYYKPEVYEGDGLTTQFSYRFNPISSEYLKVSLEIDGNWVEQLSGWKATYSANGGIVTFLLAPTVRVSIERVVPQEQPVSYKTSSGFDAKVIENSFDRLTGLVQQAQEAVSRSVKIGIGAGEDPDKLVDDIYRADAVSQQAIAASETAIEKANEAERIAREINPQQIMLDVYKAIYPVGSLYATTSSTCPIQDLIPNSVWTLVGQNRALWGGNGNNANTTIEAGLPNITGDFTANSQSGQASGAFRITRTTSNGRDSDYNSHRYIEFNASYSSPIYGNSTTVQPPAYVINIFRRIQ